MRGKVRQTSEGERRNECEKKKRRRKGRGNEIGGKGRWIFFQKKKKKEGI